MTQKARERQANGLLQCSTMRVIQALSQTFALMTHEDVSLSDSHLLPETSAPAVLTHDEQPGSLYLQITTHSGRTVKPPQRYGT